MLRDDFVGARAQVAFDIMLPYSEYLPAHPTQLGEVSSISITILADLLAPKLR